MKKTYISILALCFTFASIQAQRVLEWSVGEIALESETASELCYPLQVSISDESRTPELGTGTLRFFYDSGLLSNLNFKNVQSGYIVSGIIESPPVYGDVFNFETQLGTFVMANIIENPARKIALSTTPVTIMDICFSVSPRASFPLCAPIVFDENHIGAGKGIVKDDGYLQSDAGIVGLYYLDQNYQKANLADDEVVNFLWEEHAGFDGKLDALTDDAGMTVTSGCIEPSDATTSNDFNDPLGTMTVKVSPNPVIAGQEVSLQLFPSMGKVQEFVVFDALGHEVYRLKTSTSASIPTDRLKVGLYYLHIVDGGIVSKIVVH